MSSEDMRAAVRWWLRQNERRIAHANELEEVAIQCHLHGDEENADVLDRWSFTLRKTSNCLAGDAAGPALREYGFNLLGDYYGWSTERKPHRYMPLVTQQRKARPSYLRYAGKLD